ncbi:conserved Plasmodium protein, unknown function [Plasmodium gallinaceum]|uniref:Uncharacterized protein n=1 Tax=Plasmodium gallinaceum TaxID=5849 RepID=A0A1J1GSI9_PLAGA|nr:conserved Plasmodium protein, unknown function [Plasmodium gallinaceum]CRG95431.1 conserved Plasmodium protein, unknown function [Plasmodium gallinaceum]
MYINKVNLFKYEEKNKKLNSFLLNSNYSMNNNDNKNIQQMNLEKCEKASILLDNFNVLNQLTLKEENKKFQRNALNDYILYNYDNIGYEKSTDSNFSNSENIFDLTKFHFKERNHESSLNENSLYDNSKYIYENKYKNIDYNRNYEKESEVYYQDIISNNYEDSEENEDNSDEKINFRHNSQNTNNNYYNKLEKYKYNEKNNYEDINICTNNKVENISRKKKTKCNYIEKIFDLKKEKDLLKDKKNNSGDIKKKNEVENKFVMENKNKNILKEKNIKNKRKNEIFYEKLLKEKVNFYEEEKEEIKKSFENKLEEVIKNYEEEKEKKKNLINNIYTKYINIKNELIKANNEKQNLKKENDILKEELKNPTNYCINNKMLNSYKEKLDYYIFLSKNKDIKIKNLEEELKATRKNLEEKEKISCVISEEKKNLHKMNVLLKKDTIYLQKKLEKLKKMKEEMKEIILYKEMKINYFINILNIIDETIMNENENNKQPKKKGNDKVEIDAIKNINKKIIIKSILHKIKDLNKKIKKHDKTLENFQNQDDKFLYNKDEVILKSNNNDKKEKNENELIDNYFNSQNFILNEDEQNLIKENEHIKTFFTNYNESNTNDILINNLEAKIELENVENANVDVKKKE